tara:strand:- start:1126 stop:1323 length:198 start_codon:yes stop_codon:yes gene_type:complete
MDATNTPTKLPPSVSTEQSYLDAYVKTFDEKELKAYNIAVEHLGMSFQLEKSIGYIAWKKENVTT